MNIKLADRVNRVEEYYFSRKLKEIATLRAEGQDIINLGIGSPDLKPAEVIINRLSSEAQNDKQHGYQSYRGIPEFRNAIANWYDRKLHVTLNPEEEILPLIGSKEGIMHISMTYLQEGDKVLVPNPGYPTYRSATFLAGATPISYHLDDEQGWMPQLEVLEEMDLTKVKMMWLNYPHMPTGAVASRHTLEKLVEFAHKHQILLCHDNPYVFILNNQPQSILEIDNARNVSIELSSLSKTFNMAGWRVGFMAGNSKRVNEVLRFKSNMDSGMFMPIQLAAVEALNQPDAWYDQLNQIYAKRRKMAESMLSMLECTFNKNQAGMFVWAKIPDSFLDGFSFVDTLLKNAQVFISPGNIFGSNGNRYVRVSLCSDESIFQAAMDRIAIVSQLKSVAI